MQPQYYSVWFYELIQGLLANDKRKQTNKKIKLAFF